MNDQLASAKEPLQTGSAVPLPHPTANSALTTDRDLLSAMLDATHMLVACMDHDFNFLLVNRAYAEADGREPDFFIGKNHFILYPHEENGAIFRRVVESGEPYRIYAKPFSYPDHPERGVSYWDWSLMPVRGPSGCTERLVLTLADVTPRMRLEEELRRAKQLAEEANRVKSQFLANMSHEIRTPMSGVLGMLELVLESDLPQTQRQQLELAKEAADALLQVINDILDFSRIEEKKLVFACEPFSLRQCVGSTVDLLTPKAREKGLDLSVEISPAVPEFAVGDQNRLRQVLVNLIGNAIKFTEGGRISVKVESGAEPGPGKHCLRFTVTDTGIGIAQEKLGLLFKPFSQVDSSHSRRFGGTGLGLVICREIVQRMGGEIRVESQCGRGSAFSFTACFSQTPATLPGQPARKKMPTPSAETILTRPARILLAEDDAMIRQLLKMLLERTNWETVMVTNGREAVESWRQGAFDLLLLDVQMPELDGFEAARVIRDQERASGGRVPIVALTAHAMEADRARCLAAGMDDCLTKPIEFEKLFATLDKYFRQQRNFRGEKGGNMPRGKGATGPQRPLEGR